MKIEQFLTYHPDFYKYDPVEGVHWERERTSVIQHTRYVEKIESIERSRPNESDTIKKYRKDNYRQITKAPINKLLTKVPRSLYNSGLKIGTTSKVLNDWLQRKPFKLNSNRVDIKEFWRSCVCVEGIEDPNAVLIAFPYNDINANVPPNEAPVNGGVDKFKHVPIKPRIIPSSSIQFKSDDYDVFIWQEGETEFEETNQPYYFAVDCEAFYRLLPTGKTKDGITYSAQLWAIHGSGFLTEKGEFEPLLPICTMSGIWTKTEDGQHGYNETLIKSAIEYLTDFANRYSDLSIILTRFAHPKEVANDRIDCNNCKGTGKVGVTKSTRYPTGEMTCHVCNGHRIQPEGGPAGTYQRTQRSLDKGNNRPLFEFLHPDPSILQLVYEQTFDILKRAEQELGLHALINTSESGKMGEIRLQPSKDFMQDFAEAFYQNCMGRFLFFVECLLEIDPKKRETPVIQMPITYSTDEPEKVEERAKNTLDALRGEKVLQIIRKENENSPHVHRVWKYALAYCPLLFQEKDCLTFFLEQGVFERNEIRKAYLLPNVVMEYLKVKRALDISEQDFISFADNYLKGKIVEPTIIIENEISG